MSTSPTSSFMSNDLSRPTTNRSYSLPSSQSQISGNSRPSSPVSTHSTRKSPRRPSIPGATMDYSLSMAELLAGPPSPPQYTMAVYHEPLAGLCFSQLEVDTNPIPYPTSRPCSPVSARSMAIRFDPSVNPSRPTPSSPNRRTSPERRSQPISPNRRKSTPGPWVHRPIAERSFSSPDKPTMSRLPSTEEITFFPPLEQDETVPDSEKQQDNSEEKDENGVTAPPNTPDEIGWGKGGFFGTISRGLRVAQLWKPVSPSTNHSTLPTLPSSPNVQNSSLAAPVIQRTHSSPTSLPPPSNSPRASPSRPQSPPMGQRDPLWYLNMAKAYNPALHILSESPVPGRPSSGAKHLPPSRPQSRRGQRSGMETPRRPQSPLAPVTQVDYELGDKATGWVFRPRLDTTESTKNTVGTRYDYHEWGMSSPNPSRNALPTQALVVPSLNHGR
ncbi:hypothetical protein M231_00519 [Tremella mesenterica]|uniref:Uncharacterized protein n=1 Tax=Tremella mesenterica TaxID=5217 RepID=A0A4Q1BVT0_TREME|nr:hypothetical protein M231_00519 [Tremella mesenterica]